MKKIVLTSFTHNWRIVFLTLLMGLIASVASTSVLADAAADYASLGCAGCHGTPPGSGANPITLSKYPTNLDLATYIDANMPLGNAGKCVASCAQEMADFIRPPVANYPPVADTSKSLNLRGAAPLNAVFDAGLSNCDDGTTNNFCSSYVWNFGDGSASVSQLQPTHVYTAVGNYTATLTVTDNQGKKATATASVTTVQAESLATYVSACKTQVGFTTLPSINCYDGILFAQSKDSNDNLGATRDFAGHKIISDGVDLVFACRWLGGNKAAPVNAGSVEMLVHNRHNGSTCFFSAKSDTGATGQGDHTVASSLVSPTATNADAFWDQPSAVDASRRCADCHVQGPYIASARVASTLAIFGLLNDGHDTFATRYHAVAPTTSGVFNLWNSIIQGHNDNSNSCTNGCHLVGSKLPVPHINLDLPVLLPSISEIIDDVYNQNAMPPYDDGSDYRWINLSSPVTGGSGVETETFSNAINATTTLVPKLFSSNNPNCAQPNVPNVMEAHVVGSDNTFIIAQPSRFAFLPDRLSVFNLKDGLVCLNSDQEPGQQCSDYRVHYECTDTNNNKTWTGYSSHALQSDGDHENRPANVCPSGSTATGIEAAFTAVNGWTYSSIGPNDRLASFSQYGLTCNNADQPDGQCSNYVVRYSSCGTPPQTVTRHLFNAYSNNQLTAANNTTNNAPIMGQPASNWNTQQWVIEPVLNTEYVRLRNAGTNMYLNVTTQSESALVVTYAFTSGYTSEEWIIEPIAGSTDVRLKNLWSGRYLTSQDPNASGANKVYLSMYSQGRNTSWATQRWQIQ